MSSFREVADVINSLKCWSSAMYCTGRSKKDGPILEMNVCPLLNQNNTDVLVNPLHRDSAFQFDETEFIGSSTNIKKHLQTYLIQSARAAGFELSYVSRLSRSKPNRNRLASMYFRCRHGQVQETNGQLDNIPNPTKKRRKHHTTFHAPNSCEKCNFNLTVLCDANDSKWYIQFNKRAIPGQFEEERTQNMGLHKGHLQMKPNTVRIQMKEIREYCGGLINISGKANVSSTIIAAMASINDKFCGAQLKQSQVAYFRNCHEDISELITKLDGKMSSAEKLLELMDTLIEKGDELEYCALIHSSDHGFRIRQPKGRPPKSCNVSNGNTAMSIKDIRKSMLLSDGQEVLLSIAWATAEEKALYQKHPHVIYADITEKMNREKRSLFNFVGKDGNNKIFPCFHCFMPNSSVEQFQWVYDHGFPMIVGREAIKANQVFITDGERNMYETVRNLSEMPSSPWHNTKLLRCVYHLFYQPWVKKVAGKHRNTTEEIYCKWAKEYIEYMMYNVQYEYQLVFCMAEFDLELVGHVHLLPGTKMGIWAVWNPMKACPTKWARCFKRDVMDIDSRTTSPCESYHATLKRSAGKRELANSSISKSAAFALDHANQICTNRNKSMEKNIQCHPVCSEDNNTAEYLTPYAEKKSQEIFDRKDHYYVVRYAENKWLVMHKNGRKGRRSNAEREGTDVASAFDIPFCTNTHHLMLDKETKVLTCSCAMMKRLGMPCPHVGSVIKKRDPDMFHYRWFNHYNCTNIENKELINESFAKMKLDQGGCFDGAYIGNITNSIEDFNGITMSHDLDSETAEFMLFNHVQHKNKICVQRREDVGMLDLSTLDDPDIKKLYRFIYIDVALRLDSQSQTDDSITGIEASGSNDTDDSDPQYLNDNDQNLSRKATMQEDKARYGTVQTLVQTLTKTCEGRPQLYDEFIDRLRSMNVEFSNLLVQEDTTVRDNQMVNRSSRLVSSNMPIECTPGRGRYKAAHER